MSKIWLTMISLTIVISMAACGRAAPPPPGNAPTPGAPAGNTGAPAGNPGAATVDAQAIYKQNCVSCHAVDLSGRGGPNLQTVGARLSADQITAKIGSGGGGMPPFKGTLKDPEITALAQWLAAKK